MKKILFVLLFVFLACSSYAADTKTTALTENTTPLGTDIIMMVDDPGGTPLSQKITLTNIWAPTVLIAGTQTITGDKTFSGAATFNGTTQLNRLSNIIFTDGADNMTSNTFAFAAARTLKILDYNSQIAADALLDDTTGLLATDAIVVNSIGTFTVPITTAAYALTAANLYNSMLYYGATNEIDLDAGVDGMATIIYNTGAFTITIDPSGSEVIVRDGTAQTGGVSFTLSSGAGNFVAITFNGTQWVTLGFKGTLAEGT